ncbi:hypothetical protein DFH11DRAFT_1546313 [Phellopilus nigrolimitatus]|nr:hypothetical protein DFH11DRAFT_1546313 [Phellopilus nigrolimitatus]
MTIVPCTPQHQPSTRRRSASVSVPLALYDPSAPVAASAFFPDSASERDSDYEEPSSKKPVHFGSVAPVPLPTDRDARISAIARWAAQIAPGSPPSVPSPSPRSTRFRAISPGDLRAQGYTSIVVHLPSRASPESPVFHFSNVASPPLPIPRVRTKSHARTKSDAEEKTTKPAPLTRLRSLSLKAMRHGPSPSAAPPLPALPPSYTQHAHPRSTHKKSSYAQIDPTFPEVALAQMLDGGSFDKNVRRVTERAARGAGTYVTGGADTLSSPRGLERKEEGVGKGVAGVHRDAAGGMYWDEDEALELAGLLPSEPASAHPTPLGASTAQNMATKRRAFLPRLLTAKPALASKQPSLNPDWVPLHSPSGAEKEEDGRRRGSAASTASRDSALDLDPAYAVRPFEAGAGLVQGYSVAPNLARPPRVLEAFAVSPFDVGVDAGMEVGAGAEEEKRVRRAKRERRRPAPLPLALPLPAPTAPLTASTATAATYKQHNPVLPHCAHADPFAVEREGRREFFASAFAPPPTPLPASPAFAPKTRNDETRQAHRASLSLTRGFSALAGSVSSVSASGIRGREERAPCQRSARVRHPPRS